MSFQICKCDIGWLRYCPDFNLPWYHTMFAWFLARHYAEYQVQGIAVFFKIRRYPSGLVGLTQRYALHCLVSVCLVSYDQSGTTLVYDLTLSNTDCKLVCSTMSSGNAMNICIALRWRHNDQDGVSNHQPHGCLLNRLFRRRSNKTSKLRVTGLCVGNSPGPVNSPHKGPVTRKMFPFDDVIMFYSVNHIHCKSDKSKIASKPRQGQTRQGKVRGKTRPGNPTDVP